MKSKKKTNNKWNARSVALGVIGMSGFSGVIFTAHFNSEFLFYEQHFRMMDFVSFCRLFQIFRHSSEIPKIRYRLAIFIAADKIDSRKRICIAWNVFTFTFSGSVIFNIQYYSDITYTVRWYAVQKRCKKCAITN